MQINIIINNMRTLTMVTTLSPPDTHHRFQSSSSEEKDDSMFSIFINVFSLTLLHSFWTSFK